MAPASNSTPSHLLSSPSCSSTYPGSGAYTAHWTGDNNSTWADMARSIPGIIAAGLAGIPMSERACCAFGFVM